MFPAVEGHRRGDLIDEDKKEEGQADKGIRASPDLAANTSHAKL